MCPVQRILEQSFSEPGEDSESQHKELSVQGERQQQNSSNKFLEERNENGSEDIYFRTSWEQKNAESQRKPKPQNRKEVQSSYRHWHRHQNNRFSSSLNHSRVDLNKEEERNFFGVSLQHQPEEEEQNNSHGRARNARIELQPQRESTGPPISYRQRVQLILEFQDHNPSQLFEILKKNSGEQEAYINQSQDGGGFIENPNEVKYQLNSFESGLRLHLSRFLQDENQNQAQKIYVDPDSHSQTDYQSILESFYSHIRSSSGSYSFIDAYSSIDNLQSWSDGEYEVDSSEEIEGTEEYDNLAYVRQLREFSVEEGVISNLGVFDNMTYANWLRQLGEEEDDESFDYYNNFDYLVELSRFADETFKTASSTLRQDNRQLRQQPS